jgi:aspartate kinase
VSCKKGIILVDIVSPRMRGQYGFLARIFDIFSKYGISIDLVATSEISVSLTLDHKEEIDGLRKDLEEIADVKILRNKTIISLIGDVEHSSIILENVFHVLKDNKINVQMISQGASKVNISFIVDDDEAEDSLRAIHEIFFEREGLK